jgi:hypothetical protein
MGLSPLSGDDVQPHTLIVHRHVALELFPKQTHPCDAEVLSLTPSTFLLRGRRESWEPGVPTCAIFPPYPQSECPICTGANSESLCTLPGLGGNDGQGKCGGGDDNWICSSLQPQLHFSPRWLAVLSGPSVSLHALIPVQPNSPQRPNQPVVTSRAFVIASSRSPHPDPSRASISR